MRSPIVLSPNRRRPPGEGCVRFGARREITGPPLLQSIFVLRLVSIVLALAAAGCGSRLEWYPPPEQRPSLSLPSALPFGYFVAMSDPNARAYIVGGFRDQSEGSWRWAHARPVLQFYVPRVPRLRFLMDLTFPDQTFAETGPVELTIRLNGKGSTASATISQAARSIPSRRPGSG